MPEHFDLIESAGASLGVLTAFCAFWMIGRLVPHRQFWEYPLLGWAVVYVIAVVAALCGLANLTFVLIAAGVLAFGTVLWRRPRLSRHAVAPYLAALPLLAVSVLTPPIFWDSYAHWLPNSAYLYHLNHFATAPLGSFYSLHPTYPNALPLVIYISSRVVSLFTELAGNVINSMMFLIAMGCLWQVLREVWPARNSAGTEAQAPRAILAALAFCIALPANPAIEIQYYWSAIADPALAVLVLVMIIECCRQMVSADPPGRTALLFLFALGFLASGLKPNAWLVALVLGGTAGFIGLVHRIPVRRWIVPALAIVAGTLFGTALWKLYLRDHLAIPDQFSVRPLSQWSFHLAPALLRSMLDIVKTDTLYSLVVLATMAAGVTSLLRRSFIENRMLRLVIGFVTVAMAAHVASLIAAYLGAGFLEWEISTASSFPRYTFQVGYAVCAAGLLLLAVRVVPSLTPLTIGRSPREIAIGCFTVCAVLFLVMIARPTLALEPTAQDHFTRRKFALNALEHLSAGHRVAAAGAKWSLSYLRFAISSAAANSRYPVLVDHFLLFDGDDDCAARKVVDQWMADPTIDEVLLVDAGSYAARCTRNPAPDQVWRRSDGQWQVLDLQRPEDE